MSNYPPPGYQPPPSYPTPGYPQESYPPPQPRSGYGCGGCLGKFLIFLGIVFLLLILVCGGTFYYVYTKFRDSLTYNAPEINKVTDEIVSTDIPDVLKPVGGGRFKMPFVDKTLGQRVVYSDKNHKAILILASWDEGFSPQAGEQILQTLETLMQPQNDADKSSEQMEGLKEAKTTVLEREIHGAKAHFDITEGVGTQSNKPRIRAQGAFKGKSGPANLFLEADEDTLSRAQVEKTIKSMR